MLKGFYGLYKDWSIYGPGGTGAGTAGFLPEAMYLAYNTLSAGIKYNEAARNGDIDWEKMAELRKRTAEAAQAKDIEIP